MAWLARLLAPKPVEDDSRFGYAVVGTGHGAEKMCEALRDSASARVAAVVSSSVERARKFAKRYDVTGAYSYEQFAALKSDAGVDAVYLALPVGLHRTFAEQAAAAGKHVLCEKPMAVSAAEAEAMISACHTAGRLLMVAYRLDYDPMHAEVARYLAEKSFGELIRVTAEFGIVAKPGWRFDAAMAGGGSLFDVGVYPLHALQRFFGETVIESAEIKERAGLEVDAVWRGMVSGGIPFVCRSSYIERVPDALRIEGEHGWLELEHAFAYERTRLNAELRDDAGVVHRVVMKDGKQNASLFRLEAEHLAACVRGGVALRSPGEVGLLDLQTMARIEEIATRVKI